MYDPNNDKRFKEVMIKYLENSKIICSEIKDKELQNEWKKQIDAVEYFFAI